MSEDQNKGELWRDPGCLPVVGCRCSERSHRQIDIGRASLDERGYALQPTLRSTSGQVLEIGDTFVQVWLSLQDIHKEVFSMIVWIQYLAGNGCKLLEIKQFGSDINRMNPIFCRQDIGFKDSKF